VTQSHPLARGEAADRGLRASWRDHADV